MALIEVGRASLQLIDSANKESSISFRVTPTAARAYLAAADQAARDATAVGLLLGRALAITRGSEVANSYKTFADVGIVWVNDAAVKPSTAAAVYRSNRWKVTGRTTNASVPAIDTVYVPEYLITGVDMESDGISALLSDQPIQDFVTSFVATALSKYGTAFTSVLSIQRNDS